MPVGGRDKRSDGRQDSRNDSRNDSRPDWREAREPREPAVEALALELARAGMTVVLACRSEERARIAAARAACTLPEVRTTRPRGSQSIRQSVP